MRYFNGFSLFGEEVCFKHFLTESDFCIAGFSYGAQQAFEYVYHSTKRIDRLILLSPAFFQTQKNSFVRTQLRYFQANENAYVKQFLKNVAYPSDTDLSPYLQVGNKASLEALLTYQWDQEKIAKILARGTVIEVYLGAKDKIINAKEALTFFTPLTSCYFMKEAGHLLSFKD